VSMESMKQRDVTAASRECPLHQACGRCVSVPAAVRPSARRECPLHQACGRCVSVPAAVRPSARVHPIAQACGVRRDARACRDSCVLTMLCA